MFFLNKQSTKVQTTNKAYTDFLESYSSNTGALIAVMEAMNGKMMAAILVAVVTLCIALLIQMQQYLVNVSLYALFIYEIESRFQMT